MALPWVLPGKVGEIFRASLFSETLRVIVSVFRYREYFWKGLYISHIFRLQHRRCAFGVWTWIFERRSRKVLCRWWCCYGVLFCLWCQVCHVKMYSIESIFYHCFLLWIVKVLDKGYDMIRDIDILIWICWYDIIWVYVFKNRPSKICGRQPLKDFKWYDLLRQTISSQIFKAVFHKFYLVLSWIPWPIYCHMLLCWFKVINLF